MSATKTMTEIRFARLAYEAMQVGKFMGTSTTCMAIPSWLFYEIQKAADEVAKEKA